MKDLYFNWSTSILHDSNVSPFLANSFKETDFKRNLHVYKVFKKVINKENSVKVTFSTYVSYPELLK